MSFHWTPEDLVDRGFFTREAPENDSGQEVTAKATEAARNALRREPKNLKTQFL